MLIKDKAERYSRNTEKVSLLLAFLKEETYSNFNTLKKLFGYKVNPPLYRLLNKVEAIGLIQKTVYSSHLGNMTLWGITQDGIAVSVIPEDKILPARFEPSKLKGWSLNHHLDNQLIHVTLAQKGATDWINGDRNTFLNQFKVKHRPDGLITLPNGRRIAIETERNLKTKARYQQIIASHLKARTDILWYFVFYVVPDVQKKRALMMMFDSIKQIIDYNGNLFTLQAKHHNVFRVYTMDELATLDITNYS